MTKIKDVIEGLDLDELLTEIYKQKRLKTKGWIGWGWKKLNN